MTYLKDYEYIGENGKLTRIEFKQCMETCYKCRGEGFIEDDPEDYDYDPEDSIHDCWRCGGYGEINRDWISLQELEDFEITLTNEQKQIVKAIDKQRARLKWRYGTDKPVSIHDFWQRVK